MILQILPSGGIGHSKPVTLVANQLVVRQDNGTPICVILEYGENRAQKVVRVGDPDFERTLLATGIHETVQVSTLSLQSPPPGARLLSEPRGSHG